MIYFILYLLVAASVWYAFVRKEIRELKYETYYQTNGSDFASSIFIGILFGITWPVTIPVMIVSRVLEFLWDHFQPVILKVFMVKR